MGTPEQLPAPTTYDQLAGIRVDSGVELADLPPNLTGPTWAKTLTGHWYVPRKTLGWAVIDFLDQYVKSPGGETAGEPFCPTDEQARFLLHWYQVDDTGRFAYRSGVLRRLKGWGV